MAKYDLVLFDFDGTLYDTFEGVARSYVHAMRDVLGEEHDMEEFRVCLGPPLVESFRHIFHLDEETVQKCVVSFRKQYGEHDVYICTMYDGMEELLHTLREAGIKTGIASSKPVPMINAIFERHGQTGIVDFVSGLKIDGDDATKTEVILRALDHFGIDKSRVCMVGDRYFDAEGARNAGIDFVAAMFGFAPSREEFAPYPCVCFADSAQEIADFILGDE